MVLPRPTSSASTARPRSGKGVTGDGLLVRHAIDVGDVDGQELLEIVQRGQFFALQSKFDQARIGRTPRPLAVR